MGNVAALNQDFETMCRAERERWLAHPGNRTPMPYVWNPNWWWDRVEKNMRRWRSHIDPVATQWWATHGYQFFYRDGGAFVEPVSSHKRPEAES